MSEQTPTNEPDAQRQAFYRDIAPLNLTPLWEVLHGLVTPQPQTPAAPAKWSFDEARGHIMRSGDLITAKEAERRVLILENPAMKGSSSITHTLYAGFQLVLPGEVALVHRHSQSALRFVMDGAGAYTAVNGERAYMEKFDLILTPNWHWHDHGNETEQPIIWLDGLDVPLILSLDASFADIEADRSDDAIQETLRPAGDNLHRYGGNMRPVSGTSADTSPGAQPLFHYRYEDWRANLLDVLEASEPDPHFGVKMEFVNPATAGPVMATMSAFGQVVPKGMTTNPVQQTDGAVYALCEGTGRVVIDDVELEIGPRDVFVVPSWAKLQITADDQLILFSFSDKAVQEKIALWRQKKH
jgi:gentisate 1,2-dioxygenase